MKIKDRVKK